MRRKWLRAGRRSGWSQQERFARELARPGFDPRNVVCEIDAALEHGPVDQPPSCHSERGVAALVKGPELAWIAPPVDREGRSGWIHADWITAWTLRGDELVVDYEAPPLPVHFENPPHVELRTTEPRRLRAVADATRLAQFVDRASRVLRDRG